MKHTLIDRADYKEFIEADVYENAGLGYPEVEVSHYVFVDGEMASMRTRMVRLRQRDRTFVYQGHRFMTESSAPQEARREG